MVNRTTISIKDTQKKAMDRLRALHIIDTNENITVIDFFGKMLHYYQEHRACLEETKIETLLGKGIDINETDNSS